MRFFREHKFISIVLVLVILLITFVTISLISANRASHRPLGQVSFFTKAGNSINSIFRGAKLEKDIAELEEENERLKRELLEAKLTSEKLERLEELASELNYAYKDMSYKYVSADVKFEEVLNFVNDFVINAGYESGIKKSDTVIFGDSLIGRVEETGANWARVCATTSSKISVSFKLERDNQIQGIATGSGKGTLTGYMLDSNDEVQIGDVLITSGIGTYEEGIIVGTIKSIKYNSNTLRTEIQIEPARDVRSLNMVSVIVE